MIRVPKRGIGGSRNGQSPTILGGTGTIPPVPGAGSGGRNGGGGRCGINGSRRRGDDSGRCGGGSGKGLRGC